jgi:predicted lactoylglutathione lyase
MQLGNFSISLAVKDISASKAFYEALGFSVFTGNENEGWLVMKNGDANIGLFQGMLERNAITFNPGWNQSAESLTSFTDVRDIQETLKAAGISFIQEAEAGTGTASFIIMDPDGNPIFVDQHVDSPS